MRYVATAIVFVCTMVAIPLQAQMLADITSDVETEFGIYRPCPVAVIPALEPYTVEPDFSNVSNFSSLAGRLNSVDRTFLSQNHFTVKKSEYQQLYDIYNACTWEELPIFVTTDAVLHTYHVLFDHLLVEIEVQQFVELLGLMTDSLLVSTQSAYDQSTQLAVQEAAERNVAFLGVAARLLRGDDVSVPEPVSALVDSELVLIANHDGFHVSPIFGSFSALDYSQFQPRGHYTRSDSLRAYFKAMMWYGWTIFTMEPDLFGDLARRHTLQALMLVQMLYNLYAGGQRLLDVWEDIYETTCFFVGKTDDPNIRDYEEIAVQVYGADYHLLPPDSLANASLLDAFMTEARELPEPKIPNWIYGSFIRYKGFRFMGQRFIPDAYMFAHLVLPEVTREFPKGLDMMAILGSERAYTLLDSVYHETAYANYPERMTEFKTEFAALPPEVWAQNLYWNWLYCLMPLLYEKGAGYPVFMQSLPWADKELLSALASWAELRHDTILYAKQSVTPIGDRPVDAPRSYVEPNPYLYARLVSLVSYTREGLQARGLLPEEFSSKLDLFEELLLFLKHISIKELENNRLTPTEYNNIFCFGKVMEDLVSVVKDPLEPWKKDADDMAVIADVHTDSNSKQCLEEGVGYPLDIYVIVNEGGSIRITQGAVFSYYEFTQPIADRLTDEAWRAMLTGDIPPVMPEWAASFMDVTAWQPALTEESLDNLFKQEFMVGGLAEPDQIPGTMRLEQNYPNPFNPVTAIRFSLSAASHVQLVVYDLLGREVARLVEGHVEAGYHQVVWAGRDEGGRALPTGIYIARLHCRYAGQARLVGPGYSMSIKMVLLK